MYQLKQKDGITLPPPFCSVQALSRLDGAYPIGEAVLPSQTTSSNANFCQRHFHRHT